MGPSEKSFNQVKAILGKLDRNIDQLRERRTNKPSSAPQQDAPRVSSPKAAEPTPSRTGSIYGRATPIPPSFGNN